jgi:hypothetical protein
VFLSTVLYSVWRLCPLKYYWILQRDRLKTDTRVLPDTGVFLTSRDSSRFLEWTNDTEVSKTKDHYTDRFLTRRILGKHESLTWLVLLHGSIPNMHVSVTGIDP